MVQFFGQAKRDTYGSWCVFSAYLHMPKINLNIEICCIQSSLNHEIRYNMCSNIQLGTRQTLSVLKIVYVIIIIRDRGSWVKSGDFGGWSGPVIPSSSRAGFLDGPQTAHLLLLC